MKVLKDRYQIIDKIGTGGMAEVYLAEDKELDRRVAIKILHNRYADDTVFIERFKREARSAANLSHPNIVSIFDWGKDDEGYFLVMEVLKGKSLKQIIDDKGHLSEPEAIDIAVQVCSALSYAHENRIIHRDIKPHNIIIDDSGHVKVTDFGIARIGDDGATVTQTGAMLGTPQYFSPEQAQGYITGAPSDIYALGITIFEMLTGRVPFTGDNPVAIAFKHVHEAPILPSEYRHDLSTQMEQIILKALNKEPEDRYASAEELRDALKQLKRGESMDQTIVMPTAVKKDVAKKSRSKSKPLPWMAIISVLLLAVAGLGYSLYKANQPKGAPVPNVEGRKSAKAREILKAAGFEVETEYEESEQVPKDQVISQSPQPETNAPIGSIVILNISSGEPLVQVPDVRGYSQANAANMLGQQALKIGQISYANSNSYDKDQVINQDPSPNRKVPAGTAVNLVLNNGIETVNVPSLLKLKREEAMKVLYQAGLIFKETLEHHKEYEAGLVIDQNPQANSEVKKSSVVNVTISKGPEQLTLPNFFGRPTQVAIKSIDNLGLEYEVEYKKTKNYPHDTVVSQDPAAGTPVSAGEKVMLIVAENKPKKETPTTPPSNP